MEKLLSKNIIIETDKSILEELKPDEQKNCSCDCGCEISVEVDDNYADVWVDIPEDVKVGTQVIYGPPGRDGKINGYNQVKLNGRDGIVISEEVISKDEKDITISIDDQYVGKGDLIVYDKRKHDKAETEEEIEASKLFTFNANESENVEVDLELASRAEDVEYDFDGGKVQFTNVKGALDDLLNRIYYVNPSVTIGIYNNGTSVAGSYEIGATVTVNKITWSVNNKTPLDMDDLKISNAKSYNIIANEPETKWKSGSLALEGEDVIKATSGKTFTLTYTDNHSTVPATGTKTGTSSASISFYTRRYYGVSEKEWEDMTDEDIRGLGGDTSGGTITMAETEFDFGSGKYFYYCLPTSTVTRAPSFSAGGKGSESPMSGNYFERTKTNFNNAQGKNIPLTVYQFKKTPSGQPDKITGKTYFKVT